MGFVAGAAAGAGSLRHPGAGATDTGGEYADEGKNWLYLAHKHEANAQKKEVRAGEPQSFVHRQSA